LIAATVSVAALSIAFAAEPLNIKPGLWEMTTTMTMSGAPLYVEGMNAASRAEYAKSWKEGLGKPETSKEKQCITAKDIKEADLFQDQTSAGKECKRTAARQTSTEWSMSSECKDAHTTNVIQFAYTAPSPDRFVGTMKSTLTSPNGKTVMEAKTTARWVGASCPKEDEDD
jgi:hypothetical protein